MNPRICDDDVALFRVLADFRLLTTKQVAYVLRRNLRAQQRRLDVLLHAGYVESYNMTGVQRGRGRPERYFGVSKAGVEVLVRAKFLDGRLDPRLATAESVLNQSAHQHSVNTFRISLHEFTHRPSEFTIRGISSNSPFAMDPATGHPITLAPASRTSSDAQEPGWFIPDYVFHIHHELTGKSLLFFLESDTGSEPLSSSDPRKPNVSQKINQYQEYFRTNGYKSHELLWGRTFNGFRLLLLCSSPARAGAVAKAVRCHHPSEFVWVSSLDQLASTGISGHIWHRGGKADGPRHSILGSLASGLGLPS